ncbi:MAG: hypothetical protein IPN83_20605 [Holophagales bacterium]|jgi:hypothetical protein|nr:hypothetical protein [Holophagales bacterium]
MEKVNVNKGLLAGLVAVAAGSLLAVAFLLGRSSGSGGPAGAPPRGSTVVVSGSETRTADGSSLVRIPAEPSGSGLTSDRPAAGSDPWVPADRGSSQETFPVPAPPDAPDSATTGGSAVAVDPDAAAVAKYFDAIDQIQPASLNGSPDSVAYEMAGALARGDTSGLDAMIRQTEDAKVRLAGVSPPSPCISHYNKSLESLDDAVEMLRALRSSIQSSDPAAGLANVQSRAATLQARAEALQNEDRALRQRYGLKR